MFQICAAIYQLLLHLVKHLAIDSLCKGQYQLFWFLETSSLSEKQATGRLLSSLQNGLAKRSSSYTIWFQMRCWMTSCLNNDYLNPYLYNWFCLFVDLWVLPFPLKDCSVFGNFVITLINQPVSTHLLVFTLIDMKDSGCHYDIIFNNTGTN
jgi:hypothetical protein